MGFVQFTFVDRDAEAFVTLGQTAAMEAEALAAYFEGLLPANDPDSAFMADLWSDGDCHDDDKSVSADFIERALCRPMDELLALGRAENDRVSALIRSRLARSAKAAHPSHQAASAAATNKTSSSKEAGEP